MRNSRNTYPLAAWVLATLLLITTPAHPNLPRARPDAPVLTGSDLTLINKRRPDLYNDSEKTQMYAIDVLLGVPGSTLCYYYYNISNVNDWDVAWATEIGLAQGYLDGLPLTYVGETDCDENDHGRDTVTYMIYDQYKRWWSTYRVRSRIPEVPVSCVIEAPSTVHLGDYLTGDVNGASRPIPVRLECDGDATVTTTIESTAHNASVVFNDAVGGVLTLGSGGSNTAQLTVKKGVGIDPGARISLHANADAAPGTYEASSVFIATVQ